MPLEVQILVFQTVGHAPSQVALALTCKQLARMAALVNLTRSDVSPKYAGLLSKNAFDVPELMKQLASWMPDDLRLCDHCLTNRPCDPEYWQNVPGCSGSSYWVQKAGWSRKPGDSSWHKQMHNICPACLESCNFSDYVHCDGCTALGRLGDIDFTRVSNTHRKRTEDAIRAGRFAT